MLEAAAPPSLEPRVGASESDDDHGADVAPHGARSSEPDPGRAGIPILLTTHSPEVLSHRSARADRVRIVEWREGTSHIHVLNERTKAAVSPLETIGDMLRVNGLGIERTPQRWAGDILQL